MAANQLHISKRTLLIIAGLVGLGLAIYYAASMFLRPDSIGDRPIVIKGGSLYIDSTTPFDEYSKKPTKQWDHKLTSHQLRCVTMTQPGNPTRVVQCNKNKCKIEVEYSQPKNRDNKTLITVESLFDSGQMIRLDSYPVRLENYVPMSSSKPTELKHPDNGDNDSKKLMRVQVTKGKKVLAAWDCPPPHNCQIDIEYTDEKNEKTCRETELQ